MIINQNIRAILRIFLKLKKNQASFHSKQASTAATTEFLRKILNRKKISNDHFNLSETIISLDEIIKSINSDTNHKSPGSDGFIANI